VGITKEKELFRFAGALHISETPSFSFTDSNHVNERIEFVERKKLTENRIGGI